MSKCESVAKSEDIFGDIILKHNTEMKEANEQVKNLRNRLVIEQIKNEYLNQIIKQSTNLKLVDILNEKNGNLYLKPVEKCPEVNIHMKNYIQTIVKDVVVSTEQTVVDKGKEKKTNKHNKRKTYRSVDRKNIKKNAERKSTKTKKLQLKNELLSGKDYIDRIEGVLNSMNKNTKVNQNHIKEIRSQRENLMKVLTINEYVKVTGKINSRFKRIMKNKKVDTTLALNCLIGTMHPIDMRLISMKEHTQKAVDIDQVQRLLLSFQNGIVIHEELEEINHDRMYDMFTNYSVLYFPLTLLVKQYFEKNTFNNIIYVPFKKSSDSFPFSFYTLTNIKGNGTKQWDMDSRLEEISSRFISVVGAYMIKVFRHLYYQVFNDNIYRLNFKSKCPHLENEFEQLTQNLVLLVSPISLSLKLIEIVKLNSIYIPNEQLDEFNLRMDDQLQKEKYKNYRSNNEDFHELGLKVFDDISKIDAASWLSSVCS